MGKDQNDSVRFKCKLQETSKHKCPITILLIYYAAFWWQNDNTRTKSVLSKLLDPWTQSRKQDRKYKIAIHHTTKTRNPISLKSRTQFISWKIVQWKEDFKFQYSIQNVMKSWKVNNRKTYLLGFEKKIKDNIFFLFLKNTKWFTFCITQLNHDLIPNSKFHLTITMEEGC